MAVADLYILNITAIHGGIDIAHPATGLGVGGVDDVLDLVGLLVVHFHHVVVLVIVLPGKAGDAQVLPDTAALGDAHVTGEGTRAVDGRGLELDVGRREGARGGVGLDLLQSGETPQSYITCISKGRLASLTPYLFLQSKSRPPARLLDLELALGL